MGQIPGVPTLDGLADHHARLSSRHRGISPGPARRGSPAAATGATVDAHYDTIEIALATGCDSDDWMPHLTYLQELARTTRALMAEPTREAL
jgi:hypothetical protein